MFEIVFEIVSAKTVTEVPVKTFRQLKSAENIWGVFWGVFRTFRFTSRFAFRFGIQNFSGQFRSAGAPPQSHVITDFDSIMSAVFLDTSWLETRLHHVMDASC